MGSLFCSDFCPDMNWVQTLAVGAEAADLKNLYDKAPSASIKPLITSKPQMI